MLTRDELERLKSETGFNMDLIEKVHQMHRILYSLLKDKAIFDGLLLKGGTSLNFCHLDIPRLSIDLDFNFTGAVEKDEMRKIRPELEKRIEDIGNELGFEVRNRGSSYIMSRFLFRFEKLSGMIDNVKVEINYLQRMPLMEAERKNINIFSDEQVAFTVPTYRIEELLVQKASACLNRYLPRDLFDMNLLSSINIDLNLARRLNGVYFCMGSNSPQIDLSFFDNIDPRSLDHEMDQFLRNEYRTSSEDVIGNARAFMEKLFDFDERTRKFIDDFYSKGFINSKLILPNGPDLGSHPSLLHRLEQIGK